MLGARCPRQEAGAEWDSEKKKENREGSLTMGRGIPEVELSWLFLSQWCGKWCLLVEKKKEGRRRVEQGKAPDHEGGAALRFWWGALESDC
jgi:hypothetical protein